MQPDILKIKPYNNNYREQVISVWENSVRATHDFLNSADIEYYKEIISNIDFNDFNIFCLEQNNTIHGFICVADSKIEMLFLAPDCIGKGYGKSLIDFAIRELNATSVDVNEQNRHAVQFYSALGFFTYDRSETDSEGKNYPILKMKLK